jgi:hypothetical protein
MPEPPRYHQAKARFDTFCGICGLYKAGSCLMYEVPVLQDYTCDSWKRDPSLPVKFV